MTGLPSRVRRTSNSKPSQPWASARSKAARVFSGAAARAPRCPSSSGRFTGALRRQTSDHYEDTKTRSSWSFFVPSCLRGEKDLSIEVEVADGALGRRFLGLLQRFLEFLFQHVAFVF